MDRVFHMIGVYILNVLSVYVLFFLYPIFNKNLLAKHIKWVSLSPPRPTSLGLPPTLPPPPTQPMPTHLLFNCYLSLATYDWLKQSLCMPKLPSLAPKPISHKLPSLPLPNYSIPSTLYVICLKLTTFVGNL